MSVIKTARFLIAFNLMLAFCAHGAAQQWQPFGPIDYTKDYEPFETFEVRNFTGSPDYQDGYFFKFDKLGWAFTGERTLVGSPTATAVSIPLFGSATSTDPNAPTQSPAIVNGLMSTPPDASWAGGERYEFGYVIDHHGWEVSVLDGPEYTNTENYGFGADDPTTPDIDGTLLGYGSVAILFEADPALLVGFIDYWSSVAPGLGVIRGPGTPLGSPGTVNDVNDNGVNGPAAFPTDFGDLVTFITTWQTVDVTARSELDGVGLMKLYRFKPNSRGGVVEFYYGARYMRLRDIFAVNADGGTFGTSFWDTQVDNQIVGPQVGLKWMNQRGRWNLSMQGRCLLGLNVQNLDQVGAFGESLVPGQNNRPLFFNPTAFASGKRETEFSPVVEFRVETTYNLTKNVALRLGYNATYIDNIRRASQQVDYVLPKIGLLENGKKDDIFINGVSGGFEVNY